MGKKRMLQRSSAKSSEAGTTSFSNSETRKRVVYSEDSEDDFVTDTAVGEDIPANPHKRRSKQTLTSTFTDATVAEASGLRQEGSIDRHRCRSKRAREEPPRDSQGREPDASEEDNQPIGHATQVNEPKKKIELKGRKKEKSRGKLNTFDPIETRTSPAVFVETIQQLKEGSGNEAKLQALKDIGFGAIMELNLKKQPLSLAKWMVEYRESNTSSSSSPIFVLSTSH